MTWTATTWPVILSDAVYETIETLDGKVYEVDGGFWQFRREIELPFPPRRGLVLVVGGGEEDDDEVYFRVGSVRWDVARRAWRCYGDLGIGIEHESTREKLQQDFPGWEMRWIDDRCFDEEGNLLPDAELAPDSQREGRL